MKKIACSVLVCFFCFYAARVHAQLLKGGFDADEYMGVLERCAVQTDKQFRGAMPVEEHYDRVYRSQLTGMHNKWDLWISKDKAIMAINIRGTSSAPDSWLENFYSAMIPATGTLKLDDKTTIAYKFANDPRAKVHVGWAVGACGMAPDVAEQIKAWYAKGTKQVIIEGHSQGGAVAFMLSSYLRYRVADGTLPADLVIKTYCSAAPKPGNMYFAYDFDYLNRGGWAHTVVSTRDWVPEMPFSVQTVNDVNLNPFDYTKNNMKGQSFIVRWYIKHIYNSLDRCTRKAQRKYEKFLGRLVYKQVRKYMKEYEQPKYAGSSNYMRAGTPVILQPDAAYDQKFPDTSANIFRHHLFEPYYYLVKKIYK